MSETAGGRYDHLEAARIIATADRLRKRVAERFPESGLSQVAARLHAIAQATQATCRDISRPRVGLRIGIAATLATLLAAGIAAFVRLDPDPLTRPSVLDLLSFLEAGINDLVFGGIVVVFLMSLERRLARKRALQALGELRAVAHVIDMHQLTKDPERLHRSSRTASSPTMDLDGPGLSRYLDYCSEMLSICGKMAALYLQELPDAEVLVAVQEIESLTTGLSRKIWQKLDILYR